MGQFTRFLLCGHNVRDLSDANTYSTQDANTDRFVDPASNPNTYVHTGSNADTGGHSATNPSANPYPHVGTSDQREGLFRRAG
jgi:hypothetical protein